MPFWLKTHPLYPASFSLQYSGGKWISGHRRDPNPLRSRRILRRVGAHRQRRLLVARRLGERPGQGQVATAGHAATIRTAASRTLVRCSSQRSRGHVGPCSRRAIPDLIAVTKSLGSHRVSNIAAISNLAAQAPAAVMPVVSPKDRDAGRPSGRECQRQGKPRWQRKRRSGYFKRVFSAWGCQQKRRPS